MSYSKRSALLRGTPKPLLITSPKSTKITGTKIEFPCCSPTPSMFISFSGSIQKTKNADQKKCMGFAMHSIF